MERLACVAEFKGGGTPATNEEAYWGGDIPWVSPKDMKSQLVGSSADTITEEALKNSAANLIPAGSILTVVRSGILAHSFPTALTTRDVAVNQDIKALCPSPKIDATFMHYMLRAMVPSVLKQVTRSATVHRLSTDVLKNLLIPCPPLAEQRRIVAILDEAFEGVATATANAEKNLANAQKLFEASVETSLASTTAPLQTLADANVAVFTGPFGSVLHKSDYVTDGVPLVNPINIIGDEIVIDPRKTVSDETAKRLESYRLRAGDLVVGRRGEMGRCAVIQSNQDQWLCGTGCFFLRSSGELTSDFLARVIRSRRFKLKLESIAGGATMPNLSNSDLAGLQVPVPNRADQQALIDRMNRAAALSDELTTVFSRKLTLLAELKQSILHRAFNGDLTPAEALAA
jgi:type I restriction enzyme S subunit